MTIEMKINYLTAVKNCVIRAEARILRTGRIVPVGIESKYRDNLVAKALGTYIILEESKNL